MKFSTQHLKRYRDIGRLFWRYGRSGLAARREDEEILQPDGVPPPADRTAPERLAADLEAMGPTYVKFGQVLAGRPDLLPESYLAALARLQDGVKPFPGTEAMAIVEAELGVRISKAFQRFDHEPIAAASLGQVTITATGRAGFTGPNSCSVRVRSRSWPAKNSSTEGRDPGRSCATDASDSRTADNASRTRLSR